MTIAASPDRFDVIVVGAGPGGSLTALMLAQRGRKVAIVDRDHFPRFAVGESSTPIASRVIEQIAANFGLPELLPLATWGQWRRCIPHIGGGLKRGFTYLDHRADGDKRDGAKLDGFNDRDSTMAPSRRLLVAASLSDEVGDTHWVRSDVDTYLVDCCRRRGVTVLLGHEVESVSNQSPWRLGLIDRTNHPPGRPVTFTSNCLVDASGRSGVLLQRMGYQDTTNRLRTRTAARWTHAVDVPPFSLTLGQPSPYPPHAAAVHHLVNDGWVWQLPMADGRTSLGRVWKGIGPLPVTAGFGADGSLGEGLDVTGYRGLADYLAGGSLASDPGRWFSSGRVQRLWERPSSKAHWSLELLPLPTTLATIDPLHSTGLAHALSGAQRIADLILRGAAGDVGRYEQQVNNEIELLDRVISLAYLVMENSQLFYFACMLYFAIAIRDEEDRVACGFRSDRATWFADRVEVIEVVSEMEDRLTRTFLHQESLRPGIVHDLLQKICRVDLACHDDHVYDYTFAQGPTSC